LLENIHIDALDNFSEKNLGIVQLFFGLRHVIAHNASRIDKKCIDKISELTEKCPDLKDLRIIHQQVGKSISIRVKDIQGLISLTTNIVDLMDKQYSEKLTKPRKRAILAMLEEDYGYREST
jgi:hypothetical protein